MGCNSSTSAGDSTQNKPEDKPTESGDSSQEQPKDEQAPAEAEAKPADEGVVQMNGTTGAGNEQQTNAQTHSRPNSPPAEVQQETTKTEEIQEPDNKPSSNDGNKEEDKTCQGEGEQQPEQQPAEGDATEESKPAEEEQQATETEEKPTEGEME